MSSADADTTEAAPENIQFTVKSTGDVKHQLDLPSTTTIQAVKEVLASKADIPVERQRLIYSGKVMKNEETLAFYKVKSGNTVHLVKGAASNPTPAASNARPNIPTNIASGSGNNPLAGLTGARYAGHVQLPRAEMFGPDGGMGPMPGPEEMDAMMSRPEFQQGMQMLLDNPEMLEQILGSNPMFRNMPGAREMLRSPEVRQMLLNPDFMRQMSQMNRTMGGGHTNPALNPFTAPLAAARNAENAAAAGTPPAGTATQPGQQAPPANPFAALFGAPPPGGAAENPFAAFGAPGAGGLSANPFGVPGAGGEQREPTDEEILQQIRMLRSMGLLSPNMMNPQTNPLLNPQMMAGLGGLGLGGQMGATPTSPPAPADARPPEERFQDQLRQLNDMGFTDAQRNIQALLRSGGNVQGAVEQLLGG